MIRRPAPLLFALGGIAFAACTNAPARVATIPTSSPPASDLHFDVGAVDRSADACKDFYDYACGGWRKTHPIPADRSRWSRYSELQTENLDHERAIAEDAARAGSSAPPGEQRIGADYAACMDQRGIEARGAAPLRDVLARIDAIKTAADATAVIGELHAHDAHVVFDSSVAPEPHDVRRMALFLGRAGMGLPDRDDYASTEPKAVTVRAKYRDYLVQVFGALGLADAGGEADRAVAFETALAGHSMSAVEERDPDAQNNPMTMAELHTRYGAVAWPAFFAAIGASSLDHVIVESPTWLDGVNEALGTADGLAGLRAHLRARVAHGFATALPATIDDATFDFDQRVLRGTREAPPRWKRCIGLLDRDVGDDMGRAFLSRYFTEEARARMAKMIGAVMDAFKADIDSLDWLGPDAKRAARAKLAKSLIVIGASNRMRTYDGLALRPDDPFGNTWRARALTAAHDIGLLSAPADRESFFDALPQSLDGFGAKESNATGFTAGFLQPPVFDARMDDAVNFGGLGGVIGHELTHQFDDEGRKYDDDGNLRTWWSAEDVARFEERAACFIDEYGHFHTEEGTQLDGKLTLGENLADNGGLRLSYAALRPSETGPQVDGFTPAQRFFLAWGQVRCENVTPEAERRQAKTDGHSAGRWRVDGVVSNMPEFARAFSCAEGSPMAPAKRCKLW
jgi:putative endopeptidase